MSSSFAAACSPRRHGAQNGSGSHVGRSASATAAAGQGLNRSSKVALAGGSPRQGVNLEEQPWPHLARPPSRHRRGARSSSARPCLDPADPSHALGIGLRPALPVALDPAVEVATDLRGCGADPL
jgi:hypothetical protein